MSKQFEPDAIKHFRHIAHPGGFLEVTSELVTDVSHPEAAADGSVDWRATAQRLASKLSRERDEHTAEVNERSKAYNALLLQHKDYRTHIEGLIPIVRNSWAYFLLPRTVKDVFQ